MKGKWTVCVLAAVGILFLLLGGGMSQEKGGPPSGNEYSEESESYRIELESKIGEICRKVSGDENPTVIVTLERGEEYIYAKRSDGSYIVSSGEGVLLCRKMPEVCGVAVVCRDGSKPEIQGAITELVCALLGIGTNRICVSSGK